MNDTSLPLEFDPEWRKALKSIGSNACLELAPYGDLIALRDSKHPEQQPLLYTKSEIDAFADGAKRGEFDHLFAARRTPAGVVATWTLIKAGVILPCIVLGQAGCVLAAVYGTTAMPLLITAGAVAGTPALLTFAITSFSEFSAGKFSLRFMIRQKVRLRRASRSQPALG